MSFELFVAIILVGCWGLLPLSMIIAMTSLDDELQSDPHEHH
jgi:hypothetical protein